MGGRKGSRSHTGGWLIEIRLFSLHSLDIPCQRKGFIIQREVSEFHVKRWPIPLVVKEMPIKTRRYPLTPIRLTMVKKKIRGVGKDGRNGSLRAPLVGM